MVEISQKINKGNADAAMKILDDLYQNIDDAFLCYFISLAAPRAWRPHLERYESDYRRSLEEEGCAGAEIEKRLADQDHVFSAGEFQLQTSTKKIRKILAPGDFENGQAKNTIKILYDSWESSYRPLLEELVGEIQSDIWGDLRYLRQSIAHRDSKGVDQIKKAKLIRDFLPGQEIILTASIMGRIDRELGNWYTEFLMKHFSS